MSWPRLVGWNRFLFHAYPGHLAGQVHSMLRMTERRNLLHPHRAMHMWCGARPEVCVRGVGLRMPSSLSEGPAQAWTRILRVVTLYICVASSFMCPGRPVLAGSSVRDGAACICEGLPLHWHLLLQFQDMMYRQNSSFHSMGKCGETFIPGGA